MGLLESCCRPSSYGDVDEKQEHTHQIQINMEERRKQMLEAAERRLNEQESRGLHNPEGVKQKQRKMEELERKQEKLGEVDMQQNLRWQVN